MTTANAGNRGVRYQIFNLSVNFQAFLAKFSRICRVTVFLGPRVVTVLQLRVNVSLMHDTKQMVKKLQDQ